MEMINCTLYHQQLFYILVESPDKGNHDKLD